MQRLPSVLRVTACALALSSPALAAPTALAGAPKRQHVIAERAHRATTSIATGTVVAAGGSWFTVQTSGRRLGVVNAMIATADAITRGHYWYVWGGGHPMAGVPTHSGGTVGFDCSGSVAAVLAGAGLWAPGSGVPGDAGVIAELLSRHLIAPGAGTGRAAVTLYDEPGMHIFMNINGRFFGTSDGAGGTGPHDGAGWLYDGAYDAHNSRFAQYHVVRSVLRDSTTYGHTLTFQAGTSSVAGVATDDHVAVTYQDAGAGEMVATAVSYPFARPLTGTVSSIGSGSFTLVGSNDTYTIAPTLVNAPTLSIGDQVQLSYSRRAGNDLVRTLAVTAVPAVTQVSGTVTAVAGDGSSLTLQTAAGAPLTVSTGGSADVLAGAAVGDTVTVGYITVGATAIAERVTVTAQPDPTAGTSGAGTSGGGTDPNGTVQSNSPAPSGAGGQSGM